MLPHVTESISHILVPVVVDDESRDAQLAALQLATGAGALVTLLYVHERYADVRATAQLDAIENLHQVLLAPPGVSHAAPAYPDHDWRPALRRLLAMRDELSLKALEGLDVRVACRRGDPARETRSFIDEMGVDVVIAPSPDATRSKTMRRLTRQLQQHCSCRLHIVHPPRTAAPTLASTCRAWWDSLAARWSAGL